MWYKAGRHKVKYIMFCGYLPWSITSPASFLNTENILCIWVVCNIKIQLIIRYFWKRRCVPMYKLCFKRKNSIHLYANFHFILFMIHYYTVNYNRYKFWILYYIIHMFVSINHTTLIYLSKFLSYNLTSCTGSVIAVNHIG